MKPSSFTLVRPDRLDQALDALGETTLPIAGGQSLLVLLRLRLTNAGTLVDVTRLPEFATLQSLPTKIRYGAATTHAAIEDRVEADGTGGLMPHVASGIGYRAIRNLGTIGGSLALADPAADWPVCLLALGAELLLSGPDGERRVPIDRFLVSAFTTTLGPRELITAIEVPRLPPGSRWGYAKLARKHGAFADSVVAAVWPACGVPAVTLGATTSRAMLLVRTMRALVDGVAFDAALAADIADAEPEADDFRRRCHLATARKALRQLAA